jgi:uncharacterized protein YbjT (DUF2867 family)
VSEQVLVAGATGGVGQLTVAKLLEKGYAVRAMTRNQQKVQQMFDGKVEGAIADIRQPTTLPNAMQGITHIICCTGTTAFPSAKWDFDFSSQQGLQQVLDWGRIYFDADYRRTQAKNSPEQVDAVGVSNLVAAAPKDLKRFVFVSSCGVERKDKPPYSFLNAFGVLDAKQKGEKALIQSGLPYTIVRPGRLIDGPFTSSDLNTLLKATANGRQGIVMGTGDTLTGQTSRIDVAAACVECLDSSAAANKAFELINQGTRPNEVNWAELFTQLST